MNIIEAMYIAKNSPDNIATELKSFIFGFKIREVNFFDLFLFYALYSYKPANDFFDRKMKLSTKDQVNFFVDNVNKQPEIFANFKNDYYNTIPLIKEAILYGTNNSYFKITDTFIVLPTQKVVKNKNRISENIGKFLSTQNTAYLYNYFKVDIDAI